jgi:hypothetical protein
MQQCPIIEPFHDPFMHKYMDQYPPAPPSRVAFALSVLPYRQMSPEEYAAREGRNWLCFSFGDYVYNDAVLNEWIHTLDDILFTPGRLEDILRQFETGGRQ